jgi:nicotinate-nucleotide adenylyltransferase
MVQLAFGDLPQICIDSQEMNRSGPSYTIDTLQSMLNAEPGAQLFLMVGADQAAALMTWRAWREILHIAIICVATRAHQSCASAVFDAEKLFPDRFLHLSMPAMPLSATQIRNMVYTGQSVQTLVSEPVARYIADHHLYQNN